MSPQTTPPNPPVDGGEHNRVCPRCEAKAGEPCRTNDGELRTPHTARRHGKPSLAEQFAWAEKNVPDETPAFVVGAAQMLAFLGQPVTPDAIRKRLKQQGRTKAQLLESEAA